MSSTRSRTDLVRRLDPRLVQARVEADCGGGYEALLGLVMFAGHEPPGEYDVGPEWFDHVRRQASAQLRADVDRLCAGVPTVFGHLLGLVRQARAPRDLGALIELVSRLAPQRLRLELLGSSASTVQAGFPRAALTRAAQGDQAATEQLLAAAADDERWATSVRAVLALTPERASELTVRVLRRWATDVFAEQEPQLLPRLSAQAERWRRAAVQSGWRAVVEGATGGIVLDEDVPADRVLLVPTVLGAPWVYSTGVHRTKIFCCPVRADDGQPDDQLVPMLRALGDSTRLAILRRLATGGPASLTELTTLLAMSKSAVHKHIMLLRAAGLVRVSLGNDRRYALRDLPDLTGLVARAIHVNS